MQSSPQLIYKELCDYIEFLVVIAKQMVCATTKIII
jgi:hypothetical protein